MKTGPDVIYIRNSPRQVAFFGTKRSGNAREPESLQRFLDKSAIAYKSIVQPRQSHETGIAVVESERDQEPANTDGLITARYGIVLSIKTADCVPVIYIDSSTHLIGISHQGWKGTLHNMASCMIARMKELGANVECMQCYIGPSIAAESYMIQKDRAELFLNRYPRAAVIKKSQGGYLLDLSALNRYQLEQAGVPGTSINLHAQDTYSDSNLFYSYRREYPTLSGQMFHAVVQYHDE